MNNTETIHHKFLGKYNAMRDLINYLRFVVGYFETPARISCCKKLCKQLDLYELSLEKSFANYENCSTKYVLDHYKVSTVSREETRNVFSLYQKRVCANNILDEVDNLFRSIQNFIEQIAQVRGFKTFIKNNNNLNTKLKPRTNTHTYSALYESMTDREISEIGEIDEIDEIDEISEIDENSEISENVEDDVKLFLLDLHNTTSAIACDLREFDYVSESKNRWDFITIRNNIITRLEFEETCNRLCAFFNEQRIIFIHERTNPDLCKHCNTPMVMYTDDAELRCDECGLIQILQGTVYDDSQPESQSMQGTKNKRYDPKRHCDKRLNQIQAKEDWKISEDVINKLNARAQREYRHGNGLRSMEFMTCKQIRKWLKLEKLTKHNHHAPLIRKIITSMHGDPVVPPQLTMEEEQEVLIDFSIAMSCYEKVTQTDEYRRKYERDRTRQRQRSKPNRFYYWFVLFKILSQKFRNDTRKPGLLECIHLQSNTTLAKDDDIWSMMCKYDEMKDYYPEHTDRNITRLVV